MKIEQIAWENLEGGYRIPYDASIPLNKLRLTNDKATIAEIFTELWDNLHHQGDVGTASYYSVPEIIDIYIDKKSLDWDYLGICLTIEHCRLFNPNPPLPKALEAKYLDALVRLEQYLLLNFKLIKDENTLRCTLALFATVNGQPKLGRGIDLLEDDVLEELLDSY